MKILILGVGNPLRRDDGIGPAAVRKLQELKESGTQPLTGIDIMDGGTDGLGLIEYITAYENILIIDAVDMKLLPGTVKQFSPDEAVLKIQKDSLSTHGFGIAELITLSRQLDILPATTIIGVQPADTGYGEKLSYAVNQAVNVVCDTIIKQLWSTVHHNLNRDESPVWTD